jgi:hypothetical protein
VPVRSAQSPTACMSFNYHKEHFGEVWGLHNAARNITGTTMTIDAGNTA